MTADASCPICLLMAGCMLNAMETRGSHLGWADFPVNSAQSQDCGSGEEAADGMQERGSLFPKEVLPVTRLEMISLQKLMGNFRRGPQHPFEKEKGKAKRKAQERGRPWQWDSLLPAGFVSRW